MYRKLVSNLEDDSWHEIEPRANHVVNCVGASSPDLDGYVASYVEGQQSAMKWLGQDKAPIIFLAVVQFTRKTVEIG